VVVSTTAIDVSAQGTRTGPGMRVDLIDKAKDHAMGL
jgi:hypothetical protein